MVRVVQIFVIFLHPAMFLDKKLNATAVLAQSVERVDCKAGGRGFDSWGRTRVLK